MAPTLARARTIAHEDRLTLVEHLDELRTRIIICISTLAVVTAVCFWQNHKLLALLNAPLPDHLKLLTLAPSEALTTTFTVCGYSALIISLPVLLYQAYAYVFPAFSDKERKEILPMMLLAPVLFIAGVAFCYFVVLGPAITFLTDFNNSQFNNQLRAKDYYSFVTTLLFAMGMIFEVPMVILAVVRLGIVSVAQLRKNRRYAYLACVIIATLLPTIDPVSQVLETLPLLLLFELSILLARGVEPVVAPDEGPVDVS